MGRRNEALTFRTMNLIHEAALYPLAQDDLSRDYPNWYRRLSQVCYYKSRATWKIPFVGYLTMRQEGPHPDSDLNSRSGKGFICNVCSAALMYLVVLVPFSQVRIRRVDTGSHTPIVISPFQHTLRSQTCHSIQKLLVSTEVTYCEFKEDVGIEHILTSVPPSAAPGRR